MSGLFMNILKNSAVYLLTVVTKYNYTECPIFVLLVTAVCYHSEQCLCLNVNKVGQLVTGLMPCS
jgi:hypothetical protein